MRETQNMKPILKPEQDFSVESTESLERKSVVSPP